MSDLTRDQMAEMIYESSMYKLMLISQILDEKIEWLNTYNTYNTYYDGCSDA